MNDPYSPGSRPESVPPLSDKTSDVERESAEAAARRAKDSDRISSGSSPDACGTDKACRAAQEFIQENPCLSVGIAFGLGVIAGCLLRIDDHR